MSGWAGVLAGAATVGLGSGLLPLAAYRLAVPADSPPRSTCEHCGAELTGWVRWGSACAGCGGRLGRSSWLLAAVGAVVGAGLGWRFGLIPALVPYLLLGILGVLLTVVDVACKRLPNVLVQPAIVAGAVLLAGASVFSGGLPALGRAGFAAVALGTAYLVLALLPGANLGFGDVKLGVLLGLFLGWLGWAEVIGGLLLPFLVNGPVALALLLAGRVGRRTMLPFGPAMLTGAWLAVVGRQWLVAALGG